MVAIEKEEAARNDYLLWKQKEKKREREKARIHTFTKKAQDGRDAAHIVDEVIFCEMTAVGRIKCTHSHCTQHPQLLMIGDVG